MSQPTPFPVVVHQVRPIAQRPRFRCRFCGSTRGRDYEESIGTAGWVLFLLSLATGIGIFFCWVPLLLIKEEHCYCRNCDARIF